MVEITIGSVVYLRPPCPQLPFNVRSTTQDTVTIETTVPLEAVSSKKLEKTMSPMLVHELRALYEEAKTTDDPNSLRQKIAAIFQPLTASDATELAHAFGIRAGVGTKSGALQKVTDRIMDRYEQFQRMNRVNMSQKYLHTNANGVKVQIFHYGDGWGWSPADGGYRKEGPYDTEEDAKEASNKLKYLRCKSIKGYFGRFKNADEAQAAADEANIEEKNGANDWTVEEVEEKAFKRRYTNLQPVFLESTGEWMIADNGVILLHQGPFYNEQEARRAIGLMYEWDTEEYHNRRPSQRKGCHGPFDTEQQAKEASNTYTGKRFRVKSVKGYFGRFKNADEAQTAADEANIEEKNGADDWEVEEVEEKGVAADTVMFDALINESVSKIREASRLALQMKANAAARSLEDALNKVRDARRIFADEQLQA